MSNQLCEDMIVQIFTRLPPKSLLRFRTLSKSLRSRIDSPSFIRLQCIRSAKKLMLVHEGYAQGYRYMYTLHSEGQLKSCPRYTNVTPIKYPFKNFGIVGSCNGIICLYNMLTNIIQLWNPSIRRQLIVPDTPVSGYGGELCRMRLLGFGYDQTSDDYKIVMSYQSLKSAKVTSSYVYTMKTNTWSEIAVSPTFDYMESTDPCLFNGTLSWVVSRLSEGQSSYYLVTFDLSSQVFGMIMLPEPSWQTTHVTRINGCVGVISYKEGTAYIWVRREDNNTPYWSLAFKFDGKIFNGVQRALQLTDGGELLYLTSKGVQAYNTHETEPQSRLSLLPNFSRIMCMSVCVESLVLLDTGTSCEEAI